MTDRPRVRGRARRAGGGPNHGKRARPRGDVAAYPRREPLYPQTTERDHSLCPADRPRGLGRARRNRAKPRSAGKELAGRHARPAGLHGARDRPQTAHFGWLRPCDAENPAREGAAQMTDAKPPTNPREACRARSPLCPPRATDPRRPRRGPPGGASHRPSGRRKRPATPLGSPPRPSPQDPGTHPAKRAADPELKDLRRTPPWRYDRRADIIRGRQRPRPPDPPLRHLRLVDPPPQGTPDGPG